MKTKKNGVKRKSRLIGKLKEKKRSKIMRGGSGSIIPILHTFINRNSGNRNILEIYENTDTAIGIKLLKQPHDIFFTITPMVLSVDIMQLAVNTNNIVISRDGNFMSFKNLPSLIVDTTSYGSYGYTSTSITNAKWCLIEETGLELEFKRPLSSLTYVEINPSISKLQGKVTNEQVFLAPMIDFNDEHLCLYRTNVTYKQNESDESGEPRELYERIVYIRYIAKWLENIIKENPTERFNFQNKSDLNTEQKCDLFGLEPEYIIIHPFKNTDDKDPYKEEYIICGYPNQETKQLILQFWQGILKESFNRIHIDNIDLFIELFNKKQTKEDDKIKNDGDLYKFYSSIRKEIFDYIKERYNDLSTDITKEYNTLEYKEKLDEFNKNFNINVKHYFNEVTKKYLHKFMSYIKYNFFIFKKHFLTDVSYKLIPAVFNIRELTSIHKPILERINKLIRNELPYRFGISTEGNYNPIETSDTALYDEDKEYKLFYSHYRHGQVFHIKTEYLHLMSNVSDKAHGYKYGLTLEEIIYNCGIIADDGITSYFQAVKFIYEVREHQIDDYDNDLSKNKNSKTQDNKSLHNSVSSISKKIIEPNRADKVYELYEEDKFIRCFYENVFVGEKKEYNLWKNVDFNESEIQKEYKIWKIDLELSREDFKDIKNFYINYLKLNLHNYKYWLKNSFVYSLQKYYDWKNKKLPPKPVQVPFIIDKEAIKFLLMFVSSSQEYTFIYSFNDVFYELVLKSNISNMPDIILNKLNKKINENPNSEFIDKTITFEKKDLSQVFKIVSNTKLDITNKYFKDSVKPLVFKNFSKPKIIKEQYIDTFYYYSTDLLDVNKHKPIGYKEILMPNLYDSKIHIPILINNFYKNNNNFDPNKIIYEENKIKFDSCISDKITCNSPINYIWKANYGYDFIENIDNYSNKIVVYVCPSNLLNSIMPSQKYLNNFMDLDSSHIEMLKEIKTKYSNDNYTCFVHHTPTPFFSCLHFHIIKKNLYKRNYSKLEKGSFLIQDIYISDLINNITINSNYYLNYDYSLIKD